MSPWSLVFLYAAVVAVIVRACTQEELTREPREWLSRYAQDERHPLLLRKLAYMPTCEFCLSFWVALALLVPVFDFRLVFQDARGYLIAVFTTVAVANVYLSTFALLRVDARHKRAEAEHIERRRAA